MSTVEFQTQIKDGTIEIPQAYRDRVQGDVRVIIVLRDTSTERDMIQHLLDNPLHVPNFRPMERDEIYRDRLK
jgi:hypothetical protein